MIDRLIVPGLAGGFIVLTRCAESISRLGFSTFEAAVIGGTSCLFALPIQFNIPQGNVNIINNSSLFVNHGPGIFIFCLAYVEIKKITHAIEINVRFI
jgi:hypothetical protein